MSHEVDGNIIFDPPKLMDYLIKGGDPNLKPISWQEGSIFRSVS